MRKPPTNVGDHIDSGATAVREAFSNSIAVWRSHLPASQGLRHFGLGKLMRLDSLLKNDRVTLVFEAIGDDKVRVGCSSWDDSKVILY